ncbi:hypothetical protein ACHAXT_000364 [Thalassiosira profunda]
MTELIVGFPPQDAASSRRRDRRRRAIRFAPMSQLVFVERAEESDHHVLWYNSKDYAAMRQSNKRDVLEVHRMYLAAAIDEDDKALEDVNTTGIEGLLTPGMIRRIQQDKARVVDVVLDEQERQDDARECDPVKIAEVAERHTRSAAKRAQKIGALQSRS